ncbi:MAG: serine/threonine-protein kinase [Planctomycetota bacterium]
MTGESIFHQVLELPAAERGAFLDERCSGQPGLRAAVDRLLAAHEGTSEVIDPPAFGVSGLLTLDSDGALDASGGAPCHSNSMRGDIIADRYMLAEKIGEGGMGEVWVAKQTEPVKRKVALKLIRPGMNSSAVLTRFEQERQALALMDHPNIARVFDGGLTPAGRPFFVMELVNGLPLTTYCDEARLSPRQRLEVFGSICRAIQHAHQKGIVHRDLKPANILVTLIDGKPVPKVIDFGVAKATSGKITEVSLDTQFGSVIGTLEYMAPEQAGLSGEDIDTRADIYSLGVILYELLTGLKPIDAHRMKNTALLELFRVIKEEEPLKPSTRLSGEKTMSSLAALRQTDPQALMAMLRGELDWVVMKCLEKSRERRYDSAGSLYQDIQRYLGNQPVDARPVSAAYRLQKFLQRNKGTAIAATLVLATLIVATIVSTWQAFRATAAEKEQSIQRAAAEQAREQSDESRKKAERERALAQSERKRADTERLRAHSRRTWPSPSACARRSNCRAPSGCSTPAS